jgi:hypothetical protein
VLKAPLARMFPRILGSTKKASAYYVDDQHPRKGYNLSNISGQASNNPGPWRGPVSGRQTTSVSGPNKPDLERNSDEQYIVSTESTKGSERDRDSDLDSPGPPYPAGGIAKRVELVRTSFHEQ